MLETESAIARKLSELALSAEHIYRRHDTERLELGVLADHLSDLRDDLDGLMVHVIRAGVLEELGHGG